jgi:glycosyltransferase involved in cell wall biosynthesis
MPSEAPLVSVIIPAFNCAEFLPEAVASVRRQGRDDIEIIVVDDGSTDGTASVARSLGKDIRVIGRENGGPAAARNTGIAGASGDVIAFLDADDLWPDGSLATRLARLASDPPVDVVLGQTQVKVRRKNGATGFEPFGEPWHCPLVGCGAYLRRALDAVGLFDETLDQSEDLDWFLRMREFKVPTARIEDVTVFYRLHDTNLTRGAGPKARNLLLAVKRSLDRRRAGSGTARSLPPAEEARPGRRARKEPPSD